MNNRTLYFTSSLSEEDFRKEVEGAITSLGFGGENASEGNSKEGEGYRLNRVHRGEEYLNFGFLCLRDPALFNAFLGMNLDGTSRVIYKEAEGEIRDWGDSQTEEEALPPLVSFRDIRFYPAELSPLGEDFQPNVICCRNFPQGISLEELEEETAFYSSVPGYPKAKAKTIPKGGGGEDRKIVFLVFHARSSDARYALLMLRQFYMRGEVVRFSQSYKNPKKDFNKKNP